MADTTENVFINFDSNISEYDTELKKTTKSTSDLTKETDEAQEEQEEYNKTLIDGAKDVKVFGISLNDLNGAFKSSVSAIRGSIKSLKTFKIALAATGIGLLIVALGTLATFLTKNQEGMDLLSRVAGQVGAVFSILIDRVAKLGGALLKFFRGDFAGAFADVKDSISGLGEEITNAVVKTGELEDATVALRTAQIANIAVDAKLRKDLKEFNRISEDTTKTLTERLEASQKAEAAENKRVANSLALIAEEIRILEERQQLSDNIAEDDRELAELRAESFRIQEESQERLTTQANKTNILRTQQEKEQFDIRIQQELDTAARIVEINIAKNDAIIQDNKRLELSFEQVSENLQQTALEAAQFQVKTQQDKNQAIFESSAALAGSLANLFGQETAAGKAAAIAQATINTFLGVTQALASFPPPVSFILAAAQLAAGLAAVQKIVSTPLPQVTISPTPFGRGGVLYGPSHAQGGINAGGVQFEGKEGVINKHAMAIPWIHDAASYLNQQAGGGVSFGHGGITPQIDSNQQIVEAINRASLEARVVLVTEDLDVVQNRVAVTEDRATL